MSPPSVVLAGDAVAHMVRAAARANDVSGLRLAIIGGLAVTCRLGHVHRATGDVDAVVDEVVGLAADSGAQLLVEPLRVVVAASDVDVVLPVAMPAALTATKLHAFCDRQQDEKRASDAYDIYRLLETGDREGAVANATNDGAAGLAAVMREVMLERVVDDAVRVVRYLKTYGDPGWPPIDADDIRSVVGSFTSRLRT